VDCVADIQALLMHVPGFPDAPPPRVNPPSFRTTVAPPVPSSSPKRDDDDSQAQACLISVLV